MPRTRTMTVRLSGALSDFVSTNVSETGSYENVSEYIRDLIRRDKERLEQETFDRLKAELTRAFAAPDASYHPLSLLHPLLHRGACAALERPSAHANNRWYCSLDTNPIGSHNANNRRPPHSARVQSGT